MLLSLGRDSGPRPLNCKAVPVIYDGGGNHATRVLKRFRPSEVQWHSPVVIVLPGIAINRQVAAVYLLGLQVAYGSWLRVSFETPSLLSYANKS